MNIGHRFVLISVPGCSVSGPWQRKFDRNDVKAVVWLPLDKAVGRLT
jgi:hypothetical protein